MLEQLIVFGTILGALALFISGKLRYDLVAMLALLTLALTGIVPAAEAFLGFANPAVVTVAAVLVLSRGLVNAGVIDIFNRWLSRVGQSTTLQIAALTGLVILVSSFINNVGALALMMPVAIRLARRRNKSPSLFLMPLAFGSLLGGMNTLIGTPPNILIATFRARSSEAPFRMFDFAPVGLAVCGAGVLYLALLGWRLLPNRQGEASREELFEIKSYLTEVRLPEASKLVGKLLRDLRTVSDSDVIVAGLLRGERRLLAPSGFEPLRAGDILIVEADSEALKDLLDKAGLELVGGKSLGEEALGSDDISLVEAVVTTTSAIENRTARTLNLRWRYGVNLLAVARHGKRLHERLSDIRFQVGDILLLQMPSRAIQEGLGALGLLPLAERGLRLGQRRRVALALAIFALTLGVTATGLLSADVAFATAAVAMVLTNLLSLREVYESIDWPVIFLLGAMIPVGGALEATGGAERIASGILHLSGQLPPALILTLLLVVTMLLTGPLNNAATVVLMAPIALGVARGLGLSMDPFLMAVAVGASADFLTPIGHQSNTLVWRPGGYKFGDYWRMGLPLSIIVIAIAVPLILLVWPL